MAFPRSLAHSIARPLISYRPRNIRPKTQNSPNTLTGVVSATNAQIDYTGTTGPVCVFGVANTGTGDCLYVSDPVNGDYLIIDFICPNPLGQVVLQDGCISGGNEAITATIVSGAQVRCFINAPPPNTPGWIATASATCANLEIVTASGNAIAATLPKLNAGMTRAQTIASFKADP